LFNLKHKPIKLKFYKEERLCSKKQIDYLFRTGKSEMLHPIKLMFTETSTDQKFPVKAMFVVPKKNFRKAHDRNKLKRRMKEAYRLNKQVLYELENLKSRKLLLSFIYIAKKESNYIEIETCIKNLNKKIGNFEFKKA